MRIGPEPLFPLNPIRPDRNVEYPRALGAEFVGRPLLQFPEVKLKPPEPPETNPREPLQAKPGERTEAFGAFELKKVEAPTGRGALIQVQPARSTLEPSGPLGFRVDLLA